MVSSKPSSLTQTLLRNLVPRFPMFFGLWVNTYDKCKSYCQDSFKSQWKSIKQGNVNKEFMLVLLWLVSIFRFVYHHILNYLGDKNWNGKRRNLRDPGSQRYFINSEEFPNYAYIFPNYAYIFQCWSLVSIRKDIHTHISNPAY